MWSHKSLKSQFRGNYEYNKAGKRVLLLESFSSKGKKLKTYKFTSHEAAKKAGWVRK